jgi:mRNA-degrading endonuclease YafQ of YafQ-DinJ toxin-antitoxin module
MTGSLPFSIEESENFKRSFKKLAKNTKVYGLKFVEFIARILEELIDNPYPNKTRNEPLPNKTQLPEEWTFYKLEICYAKGASGQIRLMYLVNETTYTIKLVWIYSHEQFAKRPSDQDLRRTISEILGE